MISLARRNHDRGSKHTVAPVCRCRPMGVPIIGVPDPTTHGHSPHLHGGGPVLRGGIHHPRRAPAGAGQPRRGYPRPGRRPVRGQLRPPRGLGLLVCGLDRGPGMRPARGRRARQRQTRRHHRGGRGAVVGGAGGRGSAHRGGSPGRAAGTQTDRHHGCRGGSRRSADGSGPPRTCPAGCVPTTTRAPPPTPRPAQPAAPRPGTAPGDAPPTAPTRNRPPPGGWPGSPSRPPPHEPGAPPDPAPTPPRWSHPSDHRAHHPPTATDTPCAHLHQLGALGARQTLPAAGIDVVDLHPPAQARLADPQILRDLGDRLLTQAGELHSTTPELRRLRSRHGVTPLRDDPRLRTGVRGSGSGSPTTAAGRARRWAVVRRRGRR